MENKLQPTTTKSNAVSLTSTNELFRALVKGDFKTIAIAERDLSPANSFGKPSLAKIRKFDEKNLYLCIEHLLVKLSLSLNIGKNLGEWQIVELAGDIYQKYYFYSLEEIILVLKKGRNGEFGQIYDRLDASVIMGWFDKYDTSDERANLVQNRRINKAQEEKKEQEFVLAKITDNDQIKDLMRAMASNKVNAKETPKIKTIFNSKDEYIKTLKESLPDATPEEIGAIKSAAHLKGARFVLDVIEEFEKANP
jgi:hypothetical protein